MTPPGENPEQNPLSCQSVLCWRSMTSSKVYTQPSHAALLSSKLANQHIPALSSNKKNPKNVSVQILLHSENYHEQINQHLRGGTYSESKTTREDKHTLS